jgi:(1->4)-alpha-D-glucan 1-alpha-D-glucosylmutase
MARYMQKTAREAKLRTSWLDPDPEYEAALERFVRGVSGDPRLAPSVEPFAQEVARYGFANGLSQLVLKLTSPGVPDVYQGCELLDLSLVDPDNRRPVDFAKRARLLDALEPFLDRPEPGTIREMIEVADERAKLFVMVRLLRFREAHPGLFAGSYWPLEPDGSAGAHFLAYAREADGEALVVVVRRFPATLQERVGWEETAVPLGERLANRSWTDVITGGSVPGGERLGIGGLPLGWGVLFCPGEPVAPPAP